MATSPKKRREQKPTVLPDLRVPGFAAAPEGSYLITGLPRTRSAWLAALFSSDALPCFHEAPASPDTIDTSKPFGLCDPSAACLYPHHALKIFSGKTIVVVLRGAASARESLEVLLGQKASAWDAIEERYNHFLANAPNVRTVPFGGLSDFGTVRQLYREVRGRNLSRVRFDLFDGLLIEQDLAKAAARVVT